MMDFEQAFKVVLCGAHKWVTECESEDERQLVLRALNLVDQEMEVAKRPCIWEELNYDICNDQVTVRPWCRPPNSYVQVEGNSVKRDKYCPHCGRRVHYTKDITKDTEEGAVRRAVA